jgi:hypothetical protein
LAEVALRSARQMEGTGMGGQESRSGTEDYWTRTNGRRRKENEWKEASVKDSKDSGRADHTVSSHGAARDGYRTTTLLAGCDE